MTKLTLLEQDYETVLHKNNKPVKIRKMTYVDNNLLNRSIHREYKETYKEARLSSPFPNNPLR